MLRSCRAGQANLDRRGDAMKRPAVSFDHIIADHNILRKSWLFVVKGTDVNRADVRVVEFISRDEAIIGLRDKAACARASKLAVDYPISLPAVERICGITSRWNIVIPIESDHRAAPERIDSRDGALAVKERRGQFENAQRMTHQWCRTIVHERYRIACHGGHFESTAA